MAAIIVAAVYGIKRFTIRELLHAAHSVWIALTSKDARDASRTLFIRRCLTCRRCPVFYKPLRTCGSPFSARPELGCWCSWLKNKNKSATCWIRTHTTAQAGWPSKLMRRHWHE